MRPILRAIIALCIAALIGGGFTPSAIAAGPNCDALVVDNATLFSTEKVAEVTAAAQEVENAGAVVRVWTVQNLDGMTLDQYEHGIEAQCASWQSADGNRKNNLVVLMISMKPQGSGVYNGAQWNPSLAEGGSTIRTELMNPRFKDGEFAQGFIDGLNGVQEKIYNQLHPEQEEASEPLDLSWLLYAVFVIVGVGFGIFLIIFISRGVTRRREAEAKRLKLQQEARQTRDHLDNQIVDLTVWEGELEYSIRLLAARVDPSNLTKARELETAFKKIVRKASDFHGSIRAHDPSRVLPFEQYEVITSTAKKGNQAAEDAFALAEQLSQALQELNSLIDNIDSRITLVKQDLTQGKQNVAIILNDGFITRNAERLLTQADQQFAEAKAAVADKKYIAAKNSLERAATLIEQAVEDAQHLPVLRQSLLDRLADLRTQLEVQPGEISRQEGVRNQLREQYTTVCSDEIQNNCVTATELMEAISQLLPAAELKIQTQDWDAATQILQQASQHFDQIRNLLQAIGLLSARLQEAEKNASGAVQKAFGYLGTVWEFHAQYDSDIKSNVVPDLEEAQSRLTTAQEELSQDKPNYLQILNTVQDVSRTVGRIYTSIQEEHRRAEQQRADAKRKLEAARRQVQQANSYIRSNSSRVGSRATSHVNEAERLLGQVNDANALLHLALITSAMTAAEAAERAARSDVSSYTPPTTTSWSTSSGSDNSGSWGGTSGGSDNSGGW